MKNKIFIKMGGLLIGVLSIYLLFSQNIYATGTCPVPLADIESVGVLKYETDSPIEFYSSDLRNLKDEIGALGIYTDEQLTQINTDIDNLIADVSTGKRNVASEMNTYGADINLSNDRVPTWNNIVSEVDDVYNEGYDTGYEAGYNDGYAEGYTVGYTSGNTDGDSAGYTRGYNKGYDDGYDAGYAEGYAKGLIDGVTIHTQTFSATTRNAKIDLGQKHTYRYIDTTGVPNSNTGTYKPTSRSTSLDMGATNTYRYCDTSSVPNSNSGTYTASSRGASLDMGATNTYRYVNTNSVPNSNSGTYTYPANSTGAKTDLGATNTYRYVDATNVYAKGKADGQSAGKTLYIWTCDRSVHITTSNVDEDIGVVCSFSATSTGGEWRYSRSFTY